MGVEDRYVFCTCPRCAYQIIGGKKRGRGRGKGKEKKEKEEMRRGAREIKKNEQRLDDDEDDSKHDQLF